MATRTEQLMDALPPPGEPVTVAQLAASVGLARKDVARSLGRLLDRNMVERPTLGTYRLTELGLTARSAGTVSKNGPRGPLTGRRRPRRKGTLRSRLWHALRRSGKASIPELVTLAAAGDEANASHNASQYLRALERAGYLTRMARRDPGTAPNSPGFIRWLLIPDRNSGPMAPVWRAKAAVVFDPNTGETFPLTGNKGETPHG